MKPLSKQAARDIVARVVDKNPNLTKAQVFRHVKPLGIPRSTVYRVINTFLDKGPVRRAQNGTPVPKMSAKRRQDLVRMANGKVGVSLHLLGCRFGITHERVRQILREEGVRYRMRQKAPQVSAQQEKYRKSRLRRLSRGKLSATQEQDVIMDDESYFTYTGSEMSQNRGFYAGPGGDTPSIVKYRPIGKFPRKLLVRIATSPKGVSKPTICPSSTNVSAHVYITKCLNSELKPFIEANYTRGGYVFWPDLASAHYARATCQFLEEAGIPYLSHEENPPNVPQLRPIEDIWGILKQEVYRGDWTATSDQQLRARILSSIRKIDPEVPRAMMKKVGQRVRLADRHGPLVQIH